MARIGEGAFRQYVDGQDRLTAREYMSERELIRLAVNDLDDKVERTEGIREEFTNTVNEVEVVKGEVIQTKQEIETRIGDFSQVIDQTNQEVSQVSAQLNDKASKTEVQEVSTQLEEKEKDLTLRGINVLFPPSPLKAPKGDSVSDDTLAIQNLINYAALNSLYLVLPNKTFSVSTLVLKNGLKGLVSYGATIKANTARTGEAILSTTSSAELNDCIIDGIEFDCNGLARRAIFLKGSRNRISNNKIKGLNNPVNSEQAIRIFHNSHYNIVENNTIEMEIDNPFGTFGALQGIHISGNYRSSYAGLDTNNSVIKGTDPSTNNIIRNNFIYGGTHGVVLMGAEYNEVYSNSLNKQSHRNIILSPLASFNSIRSNTCVDFGSSAIHLAYGSDFNSIIGNTLFSDGNFTISTSQGEGAIQVYIHCQNNKILNNRIHTRSTRYGIRTAIHCNGTTIQGNDVNGGLQAAIAVMSDFRDSDADTEEKYSPNGGELPNPNWTSWGNGKPMDNVTVMGNTIHRNVTGVTNAGVYIAQSHNSPINYLVVRNNVIHSLNNSGHDLYVFVNTDTLFSHNVIEGNTVTPLDLVGIYFSNKTVKLLAYKNNNWQDRLLSISTATDTLDISVTNNIALSAAMTITDIKGVMLDGNMLGGRVITIKLYPGAVIVHNNPKIRLKGDTNLTATSLNQFVVLQLFSGILFETGRNF